MNEMQLNPTRIYNSLLYFLCLSLLLLSDFRTVLYDSEPDYLANALHILQSGYPLNYHHPATFSYYLISGLLLIIRDFQPDLSTTIYLIRYTLCILGAFLIYRCKNLKSLEIILVFMIIVVLNGFYMTLNVISAELLLLPASFLLLDQLKDKKGSILVIAMLYGLMINIKLSSILLMPYILIHVLCSFSQHKLIDLAKLAVVSLFTFLILSFPVIEHLSSPVIRSFTQVIQLKELLINVISNSHIFFLISLTALVLTIAFFIKNKNKFKKAKVQNFLTKENIYISMNILVIFLILFLLFLSPKDIRHFVPFLPFLISTFSIYKFKIPENFLTKLSLFIFCLFWVFFRYPNYEDSMLVDKLTEKQSGKVFFIQTANFSSEIRFIEWMNYAYGKSSLQIPKEWTNNFNKLSNKEIEFLNTRNYLNLYKYSNDRNIYKDSYRYFYLKNFNDQLNTILKEEGTLILMPKDYDLVNDFLESLNATSAEKVTLNPNNKSEEVSTYSLKKAPLLLEDKS